MRDRQKASDDVRLVGMRLVVLRALAVVVLAATFVIAGMASAGAARTAKRSPCASLGSWATPSKVIAMRSLAKRSLPAQVWRALGANSYYVCEANRVESGGLAVTSFKLPIGGVGHRVRFRLLYEAGSPTDAARLAGAARANFASVFGGYGAHPRVLAVSVIDRFLIVTASAVRTRTL
jgi:hypothetical protein